MDAVLYNGKIYVERDHFAQAVWVSGDTIRQVGSTEQVLAAAPAGAERVDLNGATVIPGLNDSHLHVRMLGENLNIVRLHNSASMAEVLQRGRDFLKEKQLPAGALLRGFGWNQDYFTDEVRMPNRTDLDKISTEHPIIFTRACGHAISANTLALQLAGITRDTPNPPGGEIERDANGESTGIFYECGRTMLAPIIPPVTVESQAEDFLAGMRYASSLGLTMLQSNDLREGDFELSWNALQLLRGRGELLTRYYAQCSFTTRETLQEFFDAGYATGYGDSYIGIGPIKLFVDGSLGARTALLREPYHDEPGAQGIKTLPDDLFQDLINMSAANKSTVVTHCIGDEAVEIALNSYDKVMSGGNDLRHGVIHAQITTQEQLDHFKRSDILAMVQPIFLHYDMYIVEPRVGPELAKTSYAFGTMTRMGIHTSYGTDCPVEDLNPFENLYCAVTRKDLKGRPVDGYMPSEGVDICTAIDNYTVESAYSCFAENRLGRIKPGFAADFVVLDADIFEIPADDILKVRPTATYMGGKKVYSR